MVAFSQSPEALAWARQLLVENWGPIAMESDLFDFDQTDYYRDEMGANLKKVIWAFELPADPGELASWKRQSNSWEGNCQSPSGDKVERPLNLDPGYLSEAKLVLATTKDRDHRIYLGQGIFAECTLYFHKRQWQPHDWTYPDFCSAPYRAFLLDCRDYLRERSRQESVEEEQGERR
ncbi:MAG: DUF4416 family protein [Planctomycetota bacterium]|nr:DUF4416 family protein [Planctomycetota bacterium]MEE2990100.1 DUF4416 family protein [Planctomycetota bacterium]